MEVAFDRARVSVEDADVSSTDARSALASYLDELAVRFPAGVDRTAVGADVDGETLCSPDGAFLLLRSDEVVVGCGGVRRLDTGVAEIKRMWIHPDWRGLGLGGRLLSELERRARALGHDRVVLDTHETLTEAIGLYRRHGYAPIERYNDNPYAHHWFGKDLA